MDISIQDYDDAATYTPSSSDDKAPERAPPKKQDAGAYSKSYNPGAGGVVQHGGGADYSNVSTGGGPPGTRSSSPSTRSNNPWGRYANGGIVDLL